MYDPDGDGLAGAPATLRPLDDKIVIRSPRSPAERDLRIEITRLDDTAGTIGAAFAVIDQLLHADRFGWWAERNRAAARRLATG